MSSCLIARVILLAGLILVAAAVPPGPDPSESGYIKVCQVMDDHFTPKRFRLQTTENGSQGVD